ncbi:MAG TPA: YfhO family protein [Pyrinomonadaceae bacterium]|nr:YfhO family protein [Pyrinomonadaceae bacterium]
MLASVALFFVAFFPQAIFGGKFLIAGDAYFYSYPLRTVAWEMIRAGQLPLWTPHVLSGYPLLAMAQLAIGYPLTWGYLFLPGHWAEQIYVLAPFLLSPIFTYAYAREVGRSRIAALLAGLGFGYGGMMCSGISNSGMLTNSMLWLPLMLIPIDRARQGGRGRFALCLVGACAAYSMSVLNGHGQSFVYTGALAAAYGLFLSLFPVRRVTGDEADDDTAAARGVDDQAAEGRANDEHAWPRGWFAFDRWRPLFVAVGAIGLAASVAAFQILETMRAARRSTRRALSYEALGEGSFTFTRAAGSLVAPLYNYIDVTTYVPPLVFLLALLACATALRRRREGRDARIFFWLAVAVTAWVLMLGSNTPFHHVVFRVPVVNSFRVPSRHALEWTFALAVLSAYGWDALAALTRARRAKIRATGRRRGELLIGWLALAAATTVGALWWRATVQPPVPGSNAYTALAESSYLWWKACFVLLLVAALWLALRAQASSRSRKPLLVSIVLLTCYVEQSAIISCWWGGLGLSAERFAVVSPVTKHLQTFAPAENRVYTRTGLFAEEFTLTPRLEGANLTALYGLHNVAGMEPLIFERYSRALGGVGPDSVTPRAGFPANDDLFQAHSRVLDLLNTKHVVSYSNLAPNPETNIYKDGISFAAADARITLAPGQSTTCAGSGEGDALALVTVLSNSIEVKQGETVAKVRLHVAGGTVVERELRAGVDTAEWAHERADVRAAIRHALAPVFDAHAGDENNSFSSYRYVARVPIGAHTRVEKIEVINTTMGATLNLVKATLYDSTSKNSTPLVLAASEWWETIYQKDGALVMRNGRALPRAWLVAEAEAVDGETALRRIRGQDDKHFDPRRTALLEVAPSELPTLAGGELTPESGARVVEYQANRLVIETRASQAAVLVVSEIVYPGWEARVDGERARIDATNYLLRGVLVPAGVHRVEMRYTAPAARVGALISACALLLLCGLAIYDWRTTTRRGQKRGV